jgi:transposase
MIELLREELQEIKARLGKDSSNSSKPPSSDPPWKPPAKPAGGGKRKRGGQPGHDPHKREMVVPDKMVALLPKQCVGCAHELVGRDPDPFRHQVTEVPQVKAHVTEYEFHALACSNCGLRTTASWPKGVPRGAFGPRLQAIIAVCSGAYRLSKRSIEELAQDFFGVRVSLGSICNLEHATSKALAPIVDEARAQVRAAPVVHVDETGWFQAAKRAWLWVAVTTQLAVFLIRRGRGSVVAKELLGDKFAGIAVTDQWRAYSWVDSQRRQLCWAHLVRHFTGLADYGPLAAAFSERLLGVTKRLFALWHQARDGNRESLRAAMAPIQVEFAALLREGLRVSNERVKSKCKEILREEPALWTFVAHCGVEPTNNAAERTVRPAVLWRKGCFGTDSDNGSRFAERILSVVATLRLQRRHVLGFVADACAAEINGSPRPSLLPG